MGPRRATALAAALLMLTAACGQGSDDGEDAAPDPGDSGTSEFTAEPGPPPFEVDQVAAGEREKVRSALEDRAHPALPEPLLDPLAVQQGGPPPDGIPPIDEPKFQEARHVDWLGAREPILSLTVGEETRGYPLQVMTWHEIVNDTVGGVPVAVTYCPLCNSGVAFEREAADRVLSFGTSGMLYGDNLVMYDRQTESLWPQLTGEAAFGVLTGTVLTPIPMGIVSFGDFRSANPESLVLSKETGFSRPYGRNPYVGYDNPDGGLLFDLPEEADRRLRVKERVIGIENGDESVAVVRASIAEVKVAEVTVGGQDLVLWHKPGQSSALDREQVIVGRDVGTVGVYVPEVDGQRLTFEPDGGDFVDKETGTRWDILGNAVEGELEGERLQEFRHLDTFWFAWALFHPETTIVRAGP